MAIFNSYVSLPQGTSATKGGAFGNGPVVFPSGSQALTPSAVCGATTATSWSRWMGKDLLDLEIGDEQ